MSKLEKALEQEFTIVGVSPNDQKHLKTYLGAIKEKDLTTHERSIKGITVELAKKSHYKRKVQPDGREIVKSPAVGTFSIARIQGPEDPGVKKIYDLMKEFSPEEMDTLEIVQEAISQDIYAYHILEDKQGNVIAHSQSSYLELPSKKRKSDEAIIFGGFIITDADYRRKGLAAELFQSSLKFGLEKARINQQDIKGVVVEGKEESEPFWNYVGLKRLYYEHENGDFYEVPYLQPPIKWDEKTGKPLDPKTGKVGDKDPKYYSAPEHLMVRMSDGRQEISVEELMSMVEVIYADNYTLSRKKGAESPTYKAIEKVTQTVKQFRDELEYRLNDAKDRRIVLMDAKERGSKTRELKSSGKNLFGMDTNKLEYTIIKC